MRMRTSIPQGRQRLAALMRETGDVITIDDAVRVFDEDRETAAKLLSRWTQQGWLRRVGPGAYVGASLETLENEHVLEDLWVLVPALFEPGYVGGRTAAQHWDLTEQIFKIIEEINAQGTTVLLVEQNALMALNAAHRGYVIQTGKIILSDTAANLAANEQVRQAYLGEI